MAEEHRPERRRGAATGARDVISVQARRRASPLNRNGRFGMSDIPRRAPSSSRSGSARALMRLWPRRSAGWRQLAGVGSEAAGLAPSPSAAVFPALPSAITRVDRCNSWYGTRFRLAGKV